MSKPQYANRRHKGLRAQLTPVVARGEAICCETICLEERDGRGRAILPGTPWHVAHADDGLAYKGPAHARCNNADGARRGNVMRAAPRRRVL